jgi:hypothetical protein
MRHRLFEFNQDLAKTLAEAVQLEDLKVAR